MARGVDEQSVAPAAAEPGTPEGPVGPDAVTVLCETAPAQVEAPPAGPPMPPHPAKQPRTWSMPKSPLTRKHVDEAGRIALKAIMGIAKVLGGVARFLTSAISHVWRTVQAIPPALQLFLIAGVLMLLGVVGAIALHNTSGLICIVVVVPVSAGILGALGYRWYNGLGAVAAPLTATRATPSATSELQRSVVYVDRKLALALSSLGTERHQQAVIALFQAKTAVELTLGTEQDISTYVDVPLRAGDHRPRIRAGGGSTSALRESNSAAAS